MPDPFGGVLLWASILSLKSLALVVVIVTTFMGPSLWRGRKWWLWVLPRDWQKYVAGLSNEELRRWWRRTRIVLWVVFLALMISWMLMAYQVLNRGS
jgi:hypothetical protein